ncbi:MAG: hypothetical protein JW984_08550 [Deltaproteobacteria bacterium]|uniref:Uncharacterized protein n=1 Tax=Candidatus Zymogenus saltonus TaxID=2844893 RepID=A0A9D8PP91_9DELT|nr:hypothetical protein [Candidatus Zymogenus saltonus]
MAKNFEFKGYTVITSLSHGLLGPLKLGLDSLLIKSKSEHAFMGSGDVIGNFPDPKKSVLVTGCTREALFDDNIKGEEGGYREIFGDRVMLEVQGYVKKIPEGQVRFRDVSMGAGDIEDMISRIVKVFEKLGIDINDDDRAAIKGELTRRG